ncbi:Uncharacterised protein [Mycobacteroides abscessus]|nr:Uncharacterised protein [Mycobacteroides abscessus]SHU57448.1 Uncharacterised protein [Mycobacteroides abscessus subsp. abscessus]SIJ61183.1 Uncharacterised protein [Mycobacteroides abscessus subsp. abscessus]
MVAMDTPHSTGRQSVVIPGSATYSTRSSAPNAAIFVVAAMNAVTGVGAPWYTSGTQKWNGTAPTLNSSPTDNMATPSSRKDRSPASASTARATASSSTVPAYPYTNADPKRKNAEENAPSRKYLSADSWDSSRRRRARAHIT